MEWCTSFVRSGLAATFGTAARLRRGRPLHRSGLILEARLRLHGTPRPWGARFLDQPLDLRGIARLSRSTGVPPPLPDILGLAFRWQQDDATADLLLATTGHTALGRRALRPATRWTGMYGSLFPYQGGERRLLLGALFHTPARLPATIDALEQAVEYGPLRAELLAAAPRGPWTLFGQVELSGPAIGDADMPTRFNPLRRPIPGLRPAGWLNEVRDAAYVAAQQTPDPADKALTRAV
ncbi:hypothetical protein FE391_28795 [Nonomuraea sp. KC401]|uniref:hypothetical protein n=1 Tax=unclassified Nonomuraea TaxID=2593643 RepID=UPI0010FEB920|nr:MULTISPECIES: hypothetical protein [unclassified Nonomuraea]NBE97743.1 hypothetical protein [Nonomuraea sp. K271]TLF63192.1 hypothetical protein FE391_28795 [Nonomuraea sp. KC401]